MRIDEKELVAMCVKYYKQGYADGKKTSKPVDLGKFHTPKDINPKEEIPGEKK